MHILRKRQYVSYSPQRLDVILGPGPGSVSYIMFGFGPGSDDTNKKLLKMLDCRLPARFN